MGFQTAKCLLCESPKEVKAEDKHWLIHLTGHKDDIIKFISNRFSFCPLCLDRRFISKTQQEDHFRWFHSSKKIIEWYFDRFIKKQNNSIEYIPRIA